MQRRGLVVDDEAAVCEMVGKVLTSAGIEALTLTRSTEAPALLGEGKFDLVFLDLHMADPDGIELARQMRRSGSHRRTPIILISDDQRPSALAVGFEAGASFFLYKPLDKDRLSRLVRSIQGIMEHERRRTRRVPLECKVRLKFGADVWDGQTIDASLSGILVESPRTVSAGSSLHVGMYLSPRLKPIVGAGSVARVIGGNRMGIHLNRLPLAESERLQEFLLPLIPGE